MSDCAQRSYEHRIAALRRDGFPREDCVQFRDELVKSHDTVASAIIEFEDQLREHSQWSFGNDWNEFLAISSAQKQLNKDKYQREKERTIEEVSFIRKTWTPGICAFYSLDKKSGSCIRQVARCAKRWSRFEDFVKVMNRHLIEKYTQHLGNISERPSANPLELRNDDWAAVIDKEDFDDELETPAEMWVAGHADFVELDGKRLKELSRETVSFWSPSLDRNGMLQLSEKPREPGTSFMPRTPPTSARTLVDQRSSTPDQAGAIGSRSFDAGSESWVRPHPPGSMCSAPGGPDVSSPRPLIPRRSQRLDSRLEATFGPLPGLQPAVGRRHNDFLPRPEAVVTGAQENENGESHSLFVSASPSLAAGRPTSDIPTTARLDSENCHSDPAVGTTQAQESQPRQAKDAAHASQISPGRHPISQRSCCTTIEQVTAPRGLEALTEAASQSTTGSTVCSSSRRIETAGSTPTPTPYGRQRGWSAASSTAPSSVPRTPTELERELASKRWYQSGETPDFVQDESSAYGSFTFQISVPDETPRTSVSGSVATENRNHDINEHARSISKTLPSENYEKLPKRLLHSGNWTVKLRRFPFTTRPDRGRSAHSLRRSVYGTSPRRGQSRARCVRTMLATFETRAAGRNASSWEDLRRRWFAVDVPWAGTTDFESVTNCDAKRSGQRSGQEWTRPTRVTHEPFTDREFQQNQREKQRFWAGDATTFVQYMHRDEKVSDIVRNVLNAFEKDDAVAWAPIDTLVPPERPSAMKSDRFLLLTALKKYARKDIRLRGPGFPSTILCNSGAFLGPHISAGTWFRVIEGCMLLIVDDLQSEKPQPTDTRRLISVEEGQWLWIPARYTYALLATEPSYFAYEAVWDANRVPETLAALQLSHTVADYATELAQLMCWLQNSDQRLSMNYSTSQDCLSVLQDLSCQRPHRTTGEPQAKRRRIRTDLDVDAE